MSRLFLLRHAKAAWAKPGMKDFDRPLDEEGIASLMRLARSMKETGLFPTALSSPPLFAHAKRPSG